jgi:RHH-type transcriptional regulator, rel operon repressor / antitoxin RelB
MLALRLNNEIEARLDHLAKVTGRSKHFYATEALEIHLQGLESKYLSAQEIADIQATVDFSRIEMALAGELDPDLLNPPEYAHFFDAQQDAFEKSVTTPNPRTEAFYAALGSARITSGGEHLWRHADGSEKPYPPAK